MKLIAITTEYIRANEASYIVAALEAGVDVLHLRKPSATKDEMVKLLADIPSYLYERLVLHNHFSLVEQYHIGGLHLNRRSAVLPEGYRGGVSRSCHSLEEIEQLSKSFRYAFLSPIYNSISKVGYESNFSNAQLREARDRGVIDSRVVALGGITPDKIGQLREYGFGGVAMLGYIWSDDDIESLQRRVKEIKSLLCYNL